LTNEGDVQALEKAIQPLSELCASLGKYREGLTFFDSTIAKFDASHPEERHALGQLYIAKARFLYFLAHFEQAILTGEKGVSLLQSSTQYDIKIVVRGLNEVARNLSSLAQYEKAISYYEQAVELLKESEDFHRMADLQGNLVISLMMSGKYDKAETLAYEVKAVYERVGDWEGVIWTLTTLGHIKRFTQDYQECRRLLEEALVFYQQKQMTSSWLLCDLLSSLGTAHRYVKQYSLAIEYHQRALDVARATENLFKLPSILLGLAYSATGLGNFEQAKNYFRECLTFLSSSKEQVILFNALIGWAKNETALKNYQEAAKVVGFIKTQANLDDEDRREMEEALEGLLGKVASKTLEAFFEDGKKMTLEQILELILEK
jgi:tetratricopeptide (TPR) repeat protein